MPPPPGDQNCSTTQIIYFPFDAEFHVNLKPAFLSTFQKNNWNLSFDLLGNASSFLFILQAFFHSYQMLFDRVIFFLLFLVH